MNLKNHYHETFSAYIYLALKRDHASFYLPDCIIKLKYHLYRPVLKYYIFIRHSNYYNFILHFFSLSLKLSGKSINFDDKKISKSNFYINKKLFNIYDLDVDKVLVPKKESYGTKNSFKYFIEYNDNDVIRPLCVKLPQMTGYVKHFDSKKTMSFKASVNKLLKKYTKI